jgi:hypothetical protein
MRPIASPGARIESERGKSSLASRPIEPHATMAVWDGPNAVDAARIDGSGTSRVQIISAAHGRIVDAHHRGRRGGLLKRIGDDKGHGKTEIRHVLVVERRHRAREAVRQIDRAERVLRRRIVLGEHKPYARRTLRVAHIHRGDAAPGNRRGNDDAVEGGALRRIFVGIRRLARHLEAAIDAVEGKPDRIGEFGFSHGRFPQMVPVASAKVARNVRRASGILKSLWP